jgi:hypothetical protein
MIRGVGPIASISSPGSARVPLLVIAWLCALVCASLCASVAVSDDPGPFTNRPHEGLRGVLQAWPLKVSRCPGDETDLLVISAVGGPPDQVKRVTWMPCGTAVRPGDPAIVERELGPDVALVDVARVPGRSGPQLLMASATGLRVESLDRDATDSPQDFPIAGGLPLPSRPRQLSRIVMVDDWHSNGRAAALVPASDGGRLIDLSSGETRRLPMPIFANYRSWDPFLPRTIWTWLLAETRWPTLARADDNGDGRLDLFALSRWEIWIYHAGPEGLPSEPSRRIVYVPFEEELERRHETTALTYFARDIDGDTRADLVLSTVGGGLAAGRSVTEIHLNSGSGVSIAHPPAARQETKGGFSDINLIDLDGDGREEIVELSLEFGVLKVVSLLLTGRMDVTLRVLRLEPDSPEGLKTEFEDELSFKIDLASSNIEGLVPTLGDWNGDGIQDLYVIKGSDAISFRLGAAPGDGPRFGKATGRQPLPLVSGESRIADLDGDGLDDIVAFDHAESEAHLLVLHNQGRLPGTRPTLRAQE